MNIIRSALPADRAEDFSSLRHHHAACPRKTVSLVTRDFPKHPILAELDFVAMLQTSPECCRLAVLKPVSRVRISLARQPVRHFCVLCGKIENTLEVRGFLFTYGHQRISDSAISS
jgi:hypothetical protein